MPRKKSGYPQVDQAFAKLDYTELSRLGKKGAASKKQKRFSKIYILLRGAEEAEREAHLDVCPVKD